MLKFLSVDIETTGLSPKACLVLQLGIIAVDMSKEDPILGKFEANFLYEDIVGEDYAMTQMPANVESIALIPSMLELWRQDNKMFDVVVENTNNCKCFVHQSEMIDLYTAKIVPWLTKIGYPDTKRHNLAGKNPAKFDLPFLEAHGVNIPHRHRLIDPSILYYQIGDETMPDLQQCLNRAGLLKEVAHTAISDALDVVHLFLAKFPKA